MLFENYPLLPRYHSKIIGLILYSIQMSVYFNVIMEIFIIKTNMTMENRSQRSNINRSRSKHKQKSTKYKECLSMTMLKFI